MVCVSPPNIMPVDTSARVLASNHEFKESVAVAIGAKVAEKTLLLHV